MKRIMMISMLAVLTAVPSVAQYTRRATTRPVAPVRRSLYAPVPRLHAVNESYVGLRIGLGMATVNADDPYLDGGSPKAGVNVGVVAGLQVAPATPLYLETGLSYIEKGGKGGLYDSYSYNMNYLEVPFLVKYQHNFDRLTSIQPFAGVYCASGSASANRPGKPINVSLLSDGNWYICRCLTGIINGEISNWPEAKAGVNSKLAA